MINILIYILVLAVMITIIINIILFFKKKKLTLRNKLLSTVINERK